MDELEKLKGAWKSQDYSEHKVSSIDILKMLHAKSSSYVKWIFYISIIEFAVIIILNLLVDNKKYLEVFDKMGLHSMITNTTIVSYAIMIIFIYLFYKNYKKINVDASAKVLMQNIINTRKTVKLYIYFNIGFMMLFMLYLNYIIFSNEENIYIYKEISEIPQEMSNGLFLSLLIISFLIMIGILLLLYRIIYGILLRRLKKNYKELELLDK